MENNETSSINLLGDASAGTGNGGGCCGGGDCGCGHGAARTEAAAASSGIEAGESAEFLVTGMTCGHCVASVTEEVGAVAGVQAVDVELVVGGSSRVTVRSAGPIDESSVRVAIEEAGYQLA